MEPTPSQPTDYGRFVLHALSRMTRESGTIDQEIIRRALSLSSSYLMTDTCMNPTRGLTTWFTGFNRLVDVLVVLHGRGELDLETFNEASKACSECWSVAGTWRGMEESREGVRAAAGKLKRLLDENGRTYRGQKVYSPDN